MAATDPEAKVMWAMRRRATTNGASVVTLLACATLGFLGTTAALAPAARAQSRVAVIPFSSTVSYGGTLGTYDVRGVAAIAFIPPDPVIPPDPITPSEPILPNLHPGDPFLFRTVVGAVARNTTTGQRCPAAGVQPVDLFFPTDPTEPIDFVLSYRVVPINATCRALGSVTLRYVVTIAPNRTFTTAGATAINPDY
jgi:hypothetical protein